VRRRLAAAVDELRAVASDVVWVGPDSFHVTLKFLGAVDADRLGALTETLTSAAAACEPFQLGIRGLGAFASPARPRVLWAGIEAGAAQDGPVAREGHVGGPRADAPERRHVEVIVVVVRDEENIDFRQREQSARRSSPERLLPPAALIEPRPPSLHV
jgi:2'-5' RNA ligase